MIKRLVVSQSTADTDVVTAIPTLLTVDGRTGWSLTCLRTVWRNGNSVASTIAASSLTAQLATEDTFQTFTDPDMVAMNRYATHGIAASTSAYTFSGYMEYVMMENRLTVEPYLYAIVNSTATAQLNVVQFEFQYELVKLTDLEVMRMLQGGA